MVKKMNNWLNQHRHELFVWAIFTGIIAIVYSTFFMDHYAVDTYYLEAHGYVNNAMNLAGYSTSMANLIYAFEISGAVIGGNGTLVGGALGSNPYSLPKVFNTLGLMYKEVSIDQMSANGIYIMSFWNSQDVDSMIHTIAIKKTDAGYELYNLNENYSQDGLNIEVNDLSGYENRFITGYRIYESERK